MTPLKLKNKSQSISYFYFKNKKNMAKEARDKKDLWFFNIYIIHKTENEKDNDQRIICCLAVELLRDHLHDDFLFHWN